MARLLQMKNHLMMNESLQHMMLLIDWQTVVSLVCVCFAAGYIAYRIWQTLQTTQSAQCGRCDQVPIAGIKQMPIVTEDSLLKSTASHQITPKPGKSSQRFESK